MIMKIRSFKDEAFFSVGAKGGSLFVVHYGVLLFVNHFKKTLTHIVGSEYIFSCKKCWMEDSNLCIVLVMTWMHLGWCGQRGY